MDHDVDIPHSLYPFEAHSKRVALVENLAAFPARLQFGLLLELCDEWQLRGNDDVHALRDRIVKRQAEHAAENDWENSSTTSAPTAKPHANRLKVFLCHSSSDKARVREVHAWLTQEGFEPWLDEVDLLPGEEWEYEIKRAVRRTHIILVCLTREAASKTGFMQREIRFALDAADERPEGQIFIIPTLLDTCVVPDRLSKWHWVNLTETSGYHKLRLALRKRYAELPEA